MIVFLGLFIFIEVFIVIKFTLDQIKRKRLETVAEKTYPISNPVKYTKAISIILVWSFILYPKSIETFIVFLPMLTVATIQALRQSHDIKLYQTGMVLNRTYIRWDEIEEIEIAPHDTLIVVGKTLPFGQVKAQKLEFLEALVEDVQKRLAVTQNHF